MNKTVVNLVPKKDKEQEELESLKKLAKEVTILPVEMYLIYRSHMSEESAVSLLTTQMHYIFSNE